MNSYNQDFKVWYLIEDQTPKETNKRITPGWIIIRSMKNKELSLNLSMLKIIVCFNTSAESLSFLHKSQYAHRENFERESDSQVQISEKELV